MFALSVIAGIASGEEPEASTVVSTREELALAEEELDQRIDDFIVSSQASEQVAQSAQVQADAEAQRLAFIQSEQGQDQRAESVDAFVNLSPSEARDLLIDAHGEFLGAVDGDPGRVISDAVETRMTGPGAAVIVPEPGADEQLLLSSTPIASNPRQLSDLDPVDLDRRNRFGMYTQQDPIVKVELSKDLADGIELPGGLALRPTGSDGAADALPLSDKDVFYGDIAADTDLVAMPVVDGVEVLAQLRSATSPEEIELRITMPDGAALESDGEGGAVVYEGETVLSRISPVVAFDSQGTPVNASMAVVGTKLVISVPHRGADLAYPILVDPTVTQVTDSMQWTNNNNLNGIDMSDPTPEDREWYTKTSGGARLTNNTQFGTACWGGLGITCPNGTSSGPSVPDEGLYVRLAPSASGGNSNRYQPGDTSVWRYRAPGVESYITEAQFSHAWLKKGAATPNQPYLFYALAGQHPDLQQNQMGYVGINTFTGDPDFSDASGPGKKVYFNQNRNLGATNTPGGNALVFGFTKNLDSAQDHLSEKRWAHVGGVSLLISDSTPPAADALIRSEPDNPNVNFFVDSVTANLNAGGSDNGLGIFSVEAVLPAGTSTANPIRGPNCTGSRDDPCPGSWGVSVLDDPNGPRQPFAFTTSGISNGRQPVKGIVTDVTGNATTDTTYIYVDHDRPEVALEGGLAPSSTDAGYELEVAATDGEIVLTNPNDPESIDGSKLRAGVRDLKVTADGTRLTSPDSGPVSLPCNRLNGSCSRSDELKLDPFDFLDNTINMDVEAKDMLDHADNVPPWQINLEEGDVAVERMTCRVIDSTPAPEPAGDAGEGRGDSNCGQRMEWIKKTSEVEAVLHARDADFDSEATQGAHSGRGASRGVSAVGLFVAGSPSDAVEFSCQASGAVTECPEAPSGTFQISASQLPEGVSVAAARAKDAEGLTSPVRPFELKVDGTNPTSSLSGRLLPAVGQPTAAPNPESVPVAIGPANSFELTVSATDGQSSPASAKRSGVRSIEVLLDDDDGETDPKRQAFRSQQCSSGSCPLELVTKLRAKDWGPKEDGNPNTPSPSPITYDATVIVTDHVGHVTEKTFEVTAASATVDQDLSQRYKLGLEQYFQYDSTEAGLSAVHANTATGNVVWHKTPIVNPGRGLSSVLNITHNTLAASGVPKEAAAPSAGMLSPVYNRFGVGSSGSISGLTRLNEPLQGVLIPSAGDIPNVGFTDPDGTYHSFTPRLDDPTETCGGDSLETPLPTAYDSPPGVHLRLRRYECLSSEELLRPGIFGDQDDPLTAAEVLDLQNVERAWAITRPDGVTYFYDGLGFPSSIEDRNGNVLEYEYERANPLIGAIPGGENPCRASLVPVAVPTIPGVCEPRVKRVIDPAGTDGGPSDPDRLERSLRVDYYDLSDYNLGPAAILELLVGGVTPAEVSAALDDDLDKVNSLGKVETVTDHEGRVTHFDYDSDGRLVALTEGWEPGEEPVATNPDEQFERTTVLEYETGEDTDPGDVEQLKRVIDPEAHATVVTYEDDDSSGNAPPGRRVQTVRSRRDNLKTFVYEETEDEQRSSDPSATIVKDPHDDGDSNVEEIRYEQDGDDRPVALLEPIGTALPESRKTLLTWDGDNNVTRIVSAAGTADEARVAYTYNSNGLLESKADAPSGMSDDWPTFGLRISKLTYRDSPGMMLSEFGTDSGEGFVSDLTSMRKPLGNAWSFGLDESGYSQAGPRGNVTSEIAPDGGTKRTSYDNKGQITEVIDEVGSKTQFPSASYDANGLPQEMFDARAFAPGAVPSEHRWLYRFDKVGNLRQVVDPRGAVDLPTGPLSTDHSSSAAFTTTLTYDPLHRLWTERTPKDSTSSELDERFINRSYAYDLNDNQVEVIDGNGQKTEMDYTAMDRLASELTAENELSVYCYDREERLTRTISPRGSQASVTCGSGRGYSTQHILDDAGRRVAAVRESPVSTNEDLITSYAFDRRDNVIGVSMPRDNRVGSGSNAASVTPTQAIVNSKTAASQRYAMTYDETNQLTSQTEQPATSGLSLRTEFRYDANGNQTRVIDPRAFASGVDAASYTTETTYDEVDRVEREIDPLGGVTTYAYRLNGQIESIENPRGYETPADPSDFQTNFTYDIANDLETRSLPYAPGQYGLDAQELAAMKMTIKRDVVGNPELVKDYVHGLATYRSTDPDYSAVAADQAALASDHTFTNSFYDTGDLKRTERPSWWEYAGPGQPLTLATKGANAGKQDPALPVSEGVGDLGEVEPLSLPEMLPSAGSTTLKYDDEMRLRFVEDAAENVSEIKYDDVGRVTRVFRPFDGTSEGDSQFIETASSYDANGNVETTTDGEGYVTKMEYDAFDRMIMETRPGSGWTEDCPVGQPTPCPVTEHTELAYDANSNVVLELSPRGSDGDSTTKPEKSSAFVYEFEFDEADRLVKEVNPEEEAHTYGYDAAGNREISTSPRSTTKTVFDALNRPSQTTEALGTGVARTTRFGYDAAGNRIYEDAPGSAVDTGITHSGTVASEAEVRRISRFVYDGRDLLWKEMVEGDVDGATGQDDVRTTITEYDANGNLRRQVRPAGVAASQEALFGDPGVPFYSGNKNAGQTPGDAGIVANASQNATVYEYDSDDLKTAVHLPWDATDRAATGDLGSNRVRYRQRFIRDDPRGWITEIEGPFPWVDPPAGVAVDQTRYSYYDTGWIRSSTEPELDAPERDEPDPGDPDPPDPDPELHLGQDFNYEYDERGNQTLWENDGGAPADQRRIEREYFPSGTLDTRQGSIGPEESKVSVRSHSYSYNANRSLSQFSDTFKAEGSSSTTTETTRICRDGAERVTAVDDQSRPDDGGGSSDTLFRYEADGLVKAREVDGEWQTGFSCAAPAGNVLSGGRETEYTYDPLGQETLMEVSQGSSSAHEFSTSYYPSGDIRTRTKENGTRETYYYDEDGRESARVRDPQGPDMGAVAERQLYQFDVNGNRVTDERGSYVYNARDHLISWTRTGGADPSNPNPDRVDYEEPGSVVDYEVDGSGQIELEVDHAEEGATTDHHYVGQRLDYTVTSPNGGGSGYTTSYGYDAFGNMDSAVTDAPGGDSTTTYEYDEFSRRVLSDVQNPGSQPDEHEEYRYDGLDRRVWKEEGGKKYDSAYVGLSEQLASEEETGEEPGESETKRYDYDSRGVRIAEESEATSQQSSTTTYRNYSLDSQGSVLGLESGNGSVSSANRYRYDPYGSLEFGPDQRGDQDVYKPEDALGPAAEDNPFRFQNHYYDSGVGTYDMKARSYLPEIGRFTSEDRYEAAGLDLTLQSDPLTQNRYAFAGGNPISNIEWDGHIACTSTCDGKDHRTGVGGPKSQVTGPRNAPVSKAVASKAYFTSAMAEVAESLNSFQIEPLSAPKRSVAGLFGCGEIEVVCDGADTAADVAYGVGQGAEGAFYAATHPKETWEGIKAAIDDPGAFVEALTHSCDGMNVAECVGQVGFDTLAGGGVLKTVKTAGKLGGRDSDAPDADTGPELGTACGMRSFSARTRVLMANGRSKRISKLRIGDRVVAADPVTGERGLRRVLNVWVHDDTLFKMELESGSVTTTEDHPFWNATAGQWQDIDDFSLADEVLSADGDRLEVEGFRDDSSRVGPAFNLTVEGLHTYFVDAGSEFVLVHNTGEQYPLSLGEGYSARLDRFQTGEGVDFEIHVVQGGTEVGFFGSSGWFPKHGLGSDVSVPSNVSDRLKGVAVAEMRAAGRLNPKGTFDITGDSWMQPRLGSGC